MAPSILCLCAVSTLVATVVASHLAKNVTLFADKIFGKYEPKLGVPTQSVLGPVSYGFLYFGEGGLNAGFSALRDPDTDDVWFTLLDGQMWHTSGNETQYCFGDSTTRQLFEQSPFSVESVTETSVNFCWRHGLYGMPTHATNCRGCDCARILLTLEDNDTVRFQFWMSPPARHADIHFSRVGPAPTFEEAILSTMDAPYQQCQTVAHYGPNVGGGPDLHPTTTTPTSTAAGSHGGHAHFYSRVLAKMRDDDVVAQEYSGAADQYCYQLNGLNLQIDTTARKSTPTHVMNVSDVQVRFKTPPAPCDPCDVSYSVSALLQDDEYIGVGFKGRSWEKDFPYGSAFDVPRPCYFGMCIDVVDNFTSDRIALGYTSNGGCVREMVVKDFVGAPVDVDRKILKGTSIERQAGRTILNFTVSQHWQYDQPTGGSPDGPWRIMWAIGQVSGADGCGASIAYHSNKRGVAPLKWLTSGSTPCPSPADKCDICNTGACAPCRPCVGLKTGPCAPCWAKQANGSACLPGCQDCWSYDVMV